MGLTVGAFPKQSFVDQGFVGVAQLGTGCIITFATVGVDQPGALSAAVLARFTPFGLNVVQGQSTVPQLAELVKKYSPICTS